jgi:adenylate cyclase class 2
MNYEVELKAWVDDWESILAKLRELCLFIREFRKTDRYFSRAGAGDRSTSFRLRTDNGGATVTFKEKVYRDRMEFNREREFTVDDASAFAELVERAGCRQHARKTKEGYQFAYGGLTVELVRVSDVGEFVEIELMEESDDSAAHERAARRVRAFLETLGITEERIEGRSYMSLLGRNEVSKD